MPEPSLTSFANGGTIRMDEPETAAMPTMNVNLTDKLADFVRREVECGTYQNASECVRDALRLLERDREAHAAKIEALREAVAVGLAEVERGEFSDITVEDIAGKVLKEWEDDSRGTGGQLRRRA